MRASGRRYAELCCVYCMHVHMHPTLPSLTMRWCAQVTGDENIPAGRVSFMAAATDVMLGSYDGREEVVGGLMMIRPICALTALLGALFCSQNWAACNHGSWCLPGQALHRGDLPWAGAQ